MSVFEILQGFGGVGWQQGSQHKGFGSACFVQHGTECAKAWVLSMLGSTCSQQDLEKGICEQKFFLAQSPWMLQPPHCQAISRKQPSATPKDRRTEWERAQDSSLKLIYFEQRWQAAAPNLVLPTLTNFCAQFFERESQVRHGRVSTEPKDDVSARLLPLQQVALPFVCVAPMGSRGPLPSLYAPPQ